MKLFVVGIITIMVFIAGNSVYSNYDSYIGTIEEAKQLTGSENLKLSDIKYEEAKSSKFYSIFGLEQITIDSGLIENETLFTERLLQDEVEFNDGTGLYNEEDFESAIASLEEVSKDSPCYAEARKLWGEAKVKQSTIDMAEYKRKLAEVESNIKEDYDSVQDNTWIKAKATPDNKFSTDTLYLYTLKKNSLFIPRLVISYSGDDWLFIKSYVFNIDGERYTIKPEDVDTHIGYGGTVAEWSDEPMTVETSRILLKIIDSEKTTLRYSGKTFYTDRTISQSEKDALRTMVDYYMLTNGADSLEDSIRKSIERLDASIKAFGS